MDKYSLESIRELNEKLAEENSELLEIAEALKIKKQLLIEQQKIYLAIADAESMYR